MINVKNNYYLTGYMNVNYNTEKATMMNIINKRLHVGVSHCIIYEKKDINSEGVHQNM